MRDSYHWQNVLLYVNYVFNGWTSCNYTYLLHSHNGRKKTLKQCLRIIMCTSDKSESFRLEFTVAQIIFVRVVFQSKANFNSL